MSKATRRIPAGHGGLIPHLVYDPCADAIEFYRKAFGAVDRVPAPDGRRIVHAAMCDAAIKRAADTGATVLMPAQDMFWGDRYGVVTDPFGHNWSFATHLKDLTPAEVRAAMNEACSQRS
jgi:PhnB protein